MVDVSVVIPVGPYHEALLARAAASCVAQTVPVRVVAVVDHDRRGAGWARNQGLARVTTPYVLFLDADDTLTPSFVERCLSVITPRRYVYTDWLEGETVKQAPDLPWVNRSWHVITTLLWTADAQRVGGFDEILPGAEDTEFYLKLRRSHVCGLRLAEPLFHYGKEGRRAKAFVESGAFDRVMQQFTDHYGGDTMACCGETQPDEGPLDGGHPDGVLAQAIWMGNRIERGRVTGFMYPRIGNGHTTIVHPADIDARPDLWRRVELAPALDVDEGADVRFFESAADGAVAPLQGVGDIARWLMPDAVHDAPNVPVAPAGTVPDVSRVSALYQSALNPEMPLSGAELEGLKAGDTLEVTAQQSKLNRRHRPDTVTSRGEAHA